jgi:hypothetical protein
VPLLQEDQSKQISGGSGGGRQRSDSGIWLVSFMEYDLGYVDLEEKTLQPLENPFGPKVLGTMSPDRTLLA